MTIVNIERDRILAIAARHGVTRVRVFGSVARGERRPDRDIDLLVDIEPDRSLLDLIGFEQDAQESLGRRVDVVTLDGVSPHLRARILAEAISL